MVAFDEEQKLNMLDAYFKPLNARRLKVTVLEVYPDIGVISSWSHM